jgi:hypothetical protein
VLSFTNDLTGKAILRNVSGPTSETDNPDGKTGTKTYEGNNFLAFGPLSQQRIPPDEPHLVFTSGPVTVTFATTDDGRRYFTSLSRTGHQDNGCALLAG